MHFFFPMSEVTEFFQHVDQTLAYLKDHLAPKEAQQLRSVYGEDSALEIMTRAVKASNDPNDAMKRAFGPLMRFCGRLLQQYPETRLDIYLMFSGLWWDAESYSLHEVIPIFEEGITRYPDSAQLHFNVGSTYFTEANNAYFAKHFADVVLYVDIGMPYMEKAMTLDQKLVLGAESRLRAMRHRYNVAEKQLKDREIGGN